MVLTYLFSFFNPSLIESWSFAPNNIILNYDPSSLNTFPLIHISIFHLFFNLIVLYYPLSEFEASHGSLHTAIILNTLGAVTGIAYTIINFIFVYLNLADATILDSHILGSSGWVFTFLTVDSCYKSINYPTTNLYNSYNIPTIFIPLFYLVISTILIPSSSFLGHLISIICGFLIFKNIFSLITIPPFNILDKIEALQIFKTAIDSIFPSTYFLWTWEHEVKSSRYNDSHLNNFGLPVHHASGEPDQVFNSHGEKLGTSL